MFAIPAIYDGKVFHAQEAIPVRQEYDVVITFVKLREARQTGFSGTKAERLSIVNRLAGCLEGTDISLEEIKNERLARQ